MKMIDQGNFSCVFFESLIISHPLPRRFPRGPHQILRFKEVYKNLNARPGH